MSQQPHPFDCERFRIPRDDLRELLERGLRTLGDGALGEVGQ